MGTTNVKYLLQTAHSASFHFDWRLHVKKKKKKKVNMVCGLTNADQPLC